MKKNAGVVNVPLIIGLVIVSTLLPFTLKALRQKIELRKKAAPACPASFGPQISPPIIRHEKICQGRSCALVGDVLEVDPQANEPLTVFFSASNVTQVKVRYRAAPKGRWTGGIGPRPLTRNYLAFPPPTTPGDYQVLVAGYTADCQWSCSNQHYYTGGNCGDDLGFYCGYGDQYGCHNQPFKIKVKGGGVKPQCRGLTCPATLSPGQKISLSARTASPDELINPSEFRPPAYPHEPIPDYSGKLFYSFSVPAGWPAPVVTQRECVDVNGDGGIGNNHQDYCEVKFDLTAGKQAGPYLFKVKFENDEGSSACECAGITSNTITNTPTSTPTSPPTSTPTLTPTSIPTRIPTPTLTPPPALTPTTSLPSPSLTPTPTLLPVKSPSPSPPTPTLTTTITPTATLTPTVSLTPTPTPPPVIWTFIFYLSADNNMEGTLTRTLKTIKQTDNSHVNVCALIDTLAGGGKKVFRPAGGTSVEEPAGEPNMAAAATLAGFINECRQKYPADRYFLSVVNHGRGDMGVSWDDTARQYLTLQDLRNVINRFSFDLVYYDACLMGLAENGQDLAPTTSFWVQSQNQSWSVQQEIYQRAIQAAAETSSPRQLGAEIVNTYSTSRIGNQPFTIAMVDLSQIAGVSNAVSSLANWLIKGLHEAGSQFKQCLTLARSQTQKFDLNANMRIQNDDASLDLYDLADKIISHCQAVYPAITAPAQAVKAAVVAAVASEAHHSCSSQTSYCRYNWNLDNAHGLSIFFPANHSWNYTPSLLPDWANFLNTYFSTRSQTVAGVTTTKNPLSSPLDPETGQVADQCTGSAVYNLDCDLHDQIDEQDLQVILNNWYRQTLEAAQDQAGRRLTRSADINQDGQIDREDIKILATHWTGRSARPMPKADWPSLKKLLKALLSKKFSRQLTLLDRILLDYNRDQKLTTLDLFSYATFKVAQVGNL